MAAGEALKVTRSYGMPAAAGRRGAHTFVMQRSTADM
jgi:hypothetical protein